MFEDTLIPKRFPVCASDNIESEGLGNDEEPPMTEAYERCSCAECKSQWINRAELRWYQSEVTHERMSI